MSVPEYQVNDLVDVAARWMERAVNAETELALLKGDNVSMTETDDCPPTTEQRAFCAALDHYGIMGFPDEQRQEWLIRRSLAYRTALAREHLREFLRRLVK